MGADARGGAAYAAKAAGLAAPDRPEAVSEEIRWQLGRMSAAARAALRQLPPVHQLVEHQRDQADLTAGIGLQARGRRRRDTLLTHLAFEVDSLAGFEKHLAKFGLKYSDGPHLKPDGGGIAFIDAPEGYEIELIQFAKSGAGY